MRKPKDKCRKCGGRLKDTVFTGCDDCGFWSCYPGLHHHDVCEDCGEIHPPALINTSTEMHQKGGGK